MKNRKIEEEKYKSDRFEDIVDDLKGEEILTPFLCFEKTGPIYLRLRNSKITVFAKIENLEAIKKMGRETNGIIDPDLFRKYQQA